MENFKILQQKMELLQQHVEIVCCLKTDKPETVKILKEIKEVKNLMESDVLKLRRLLSEEQQICNQLKEQILEVGNLSQEFDHLQKILPKQSLKESTATQCSYRYSTESNISSFSDVQTSVVNGNISSLRADVSGTYFESPMEMSSRIPHLSNKVQLMQPMCIIFDIPPLTDLEYKGLPKYMVGRLTLSSINDFIDVINETVSRKYALLSTLPSQIKTKDLPLYNCLKREELVKMKGNRYITEKDIARQCKKVTLDKKTYTFLTILRHTKRLSFMVENGTSMYVCNK